MGQDIKERITQHQGMNIHLVPTTKFKTIQFAMKFKAPLAKETITKRSLLTFVLEQGTYTHPSEKQLMYYLDELYGAVLSVEGQKKGHYHIITVRLEIANEKYIANEQSMLEEALQLLHDIVHRPHMQNDLFPKKVVNREKHTLTDRIEAMKDDKMVYANMRLIDHMCKGEPFALHTLGYVEDLDQLDAETMTAYYKEMLKHDAVDLYVAGDIDEEEIMTILKRQFTSHYGTKHKPVEVPKVTDKQVQEIREVQDINQAKLHIGYRTNITYRDDDYFALHVFNGLFGGLPSSKLFLNVREKHSLAYYAASRIESHKGLMIVFSGIEPNDYEKAHTIIDEQLQAIIDGNFSDDEVENVKALITSDIEETLDHLSGTIELFYQQVVGEKEMAPQQFMEQLLQVTKEDVIAVSKKIVPDTVYLLTNRKEGQHE